MRISGVDLSALEAVDVRQIARDLVTSSTTGLSASLKRETGRTFNPSAGTSVYAETTVSLTVYPAPLELSQAQLAEGLLPTDRLFLCDGSAASPKPGDRLVVDGATLRLVKVGTDPLTALHHLYARGA